MSGWPPMGMSGLGVLAVWGPRRPPSPAASTTARIGPRGVDSILLYYRPGGVSPVGPYGDTIPGQGTTGRLYYFNGGNTDMWQTIGWLTLGCAVFIGMLISLSIIGLKI